MTTATDERRAVARHLLRRIVYEWTSLEALDGVATILAEREAAAVATAMQELQVRVRRTGLLENEKITRKKMAEIIKRIAPTLRDRPTFADTFRAVEAAARADVVDRACRIVHPNPCPEGVRCRGEDLMDQIRALAPVPSDRVGIARGDLNGWRGWDHSQACNRYAPRSKGWVEGCDCGLDAFRTALDRMEESDGY